MPQFQMDKSGVVARTDATGLQAGKGVVLWKDLDSFTQGYVEAMFFTEEREHVDGEDLEESGSIPHNSCFGMIDVESLAGIVAECRRFQEENAELLEKYESRYKPLEYAGHDFWLTRQGHGAGFWSRGIGDVGDALSDAARALGECYVETGDDGVIYVR